MKLKLSQVTLLGIDCVDIRRLKIALDTSQKNIEFGAVKLLTSISSDDPRVVPIKYIDTIEEFSRFCIMELHHYVETEYLLLIQYDGFVLNPDKWDPHFLEYDYIGAPLKVHDWSLTHFNIHKEVGDMIVGNGGFSLRSKKFLQITAHLADKGKITNFHPEDVALCAWYKDLLEQAGVRFASVELAKRFSVQEDYGSYESPFGFHGLYGKNMDELQLKYPDYPTYYFLPRILQKRLKEIIQLFEPLAIEGHLLGSLAKGNGDILSDIDIWLTFKDGDMEKIFKNRLDYYRIIGDVLQVFEAPQNSPINGISSSVLYKTKVGLFQVDYYLCPQSTSFKTDESKKLFGNIDLSVGLFELNPQKVSVSESFRVDFVINLIFRAIKKVVRQGEDPLGLLLKEYAYLTDRYGIPVDGIPIPDDSFETLKIIIENIEKISNENQKNILFEISTFLKKFKEYSNNS